MMRVEFHWAGTNEVGKGVISLSYWTKPWFGKPERIDLILVNSKEDPMDTFADLYWHTPDGEPITADNIPLRVRVRSYWESRAAANLLRDVSAADCVGWER